MEFINFLLKNFELVRRADIKPISSIADHSDQVRDSSLFIARKGRATDGHIYLGQAVKKGASALLVESCDRIPPYFKGMVFKYRGLLNDRLPQVLNEFYDFPSKKLFTAGVTGTNGKTSFCYMLENIYQHCGWPTAVIGTVDQHFQGKRWPSRLTSPSPAETFERMRDFSRLGAKALTMEVSSIALDQNRMDGIDFNALIFTNLSQDHLDYHKTMENYFQAKKKLFCSDERGRNLFCLVNQDDEYGKKLKKMARRPCYSYGREEGSDFRFKIKSLTESGSQFELKSPAGTMQCSLPLTGDFNVYNAVSALACAVLTGFKPEEGYAALKNFKGVPGRLEKLETGLPFSVFIDYAHTPSALACALKAVRPQGKKIILVFGCGGDRDQGKRQPMTQIALKFAHHIFFTTDNPRSEDPERIAHQALKDLSPKQKEKITTQPDRRQAIRQALEYADKGDLVLIAGKGHESFQIVGDKRIPFSDKKAVLECLKG